MTLSPLSNQRHPEESYEDYRKRLKVMQQALKQRRKGEVVFHSREEGFRKGFTFRRSNLDS